MVYPAAGFWQATGHSDACVAIVNPDSIPAGKLAQESVHRPVKEILPRLP